MARAVARTGYRSYSRLCPNPYPSVKPQSYGVVEGMGFVRGILVRTIQFWMPKSMGYGLSQAWVRTESTVLLTGLSFESVEGSSSRSRRSNILPTLLLVLQMGLQFIRPCPGRGEWTLGAWLSNVRMGRRIDQLDWPLTSLKTTTSSTPGRSLWKGHCLGGLLNIRLSGP
jgi:hypothetical protein